MAEPVQALPAATDSAPAQGLDLHTALELLQHDPCPMALCDPYGRVQWCNRALVEAAGFASAAWQGLPLDALLGLSSADARLLHEALQAQRPARLPEICWHASGATCGSWQCQLRTTPDGRCITRWQPVAPIVEPALATSRTAELLEMAQVFCRLGVWERDVRSLQGSWDRHMARLWGLADGEPAPDFGVAARSVVDEDRSGLDKVFRRSIRRAGTYGHRFRVRSHNGTLRHLRSHWEVKNGADGLPERAIGIVVDDTESWNLARAHSEALEQLGLALELGHIVVWRQDLLTDRVQFSERAHELLGLQSPVPELSAEQLRQLVHPEDQPALRAALEQALTIGRPVDAETRFRHADGSWRHLLTRRILQRDAQGRPIALIGVGMDLSERVESIKRQTELMRQFELTARTAGIGYWSVEADTKRTRWSEQTFTLHGLPADAQALRLRDWLQRFVDPADRAAVQRRYAEWVRSGRPHLEQEFRIVRCDGAVRQVLSHSRLEGPPGHYDFFGVLMDVTERRVAAAALQQAHQRAALAIRGAGMGAWEQDLLTGKAVWDEQMWRLRGLAPRAEALNIDERIALVHPDDREHTLRIWNDATQAGQPSNLEFRVRLPNGQWRWIASRAIAVPDEQGLMTRRIGVNWDITEMRTAQAAREESAVAQRESQAKSRFLSRMSHELRTPLNAVLGFAQLLLNDGERVSAETRRKRLEQIHGAGQHLLSLINDVLDLSSLEGGELRIDPQPVPLAELVAGTLPLVARLARQHKVRLRNEATSCVAHGDATRLRQVLLNLLTNAVKYNREGGQVLVQSEVQGEQVVLRVSDTGRGLSEEQLQMVFEPFNRLGLEHEGIEGTGIGLTIVRALVERMGGSVQVRSMLGTGSEFEVRLQAASGQEAASLAAATPDVPAAELPLQPAPRRRTRLLYIEDNPINLLIVQELLARRGDLQLDTAIDGTSGVRQATEHRPDLVLVDMHLPDIDGHEVLRRLRAERSTAAIPCISVSANAMPDDIQRALRAGFADYWTKPLDLDQFMRSLDAMFGTPAA